MKKFDVIVIGELNVDLIFNGFNGKFPELGKEINAETMTLTLGSSSAIMAANLSVLETGVTFLGMIGKDKFGELVLESLEEKKVDTSNIIQTGKYATGITVACSYGEQRASVTYPGAMEHLTIKEIRSETLQQARHMHYSSVFFQPGLKPDLVTLFKKAKDAGLTTSLDCQWDPHEKWDIDLHTLLPYVDLFLPNMEEIKNLTGTRNLEEAIGSISRAAHVVIVKDGIHGSYLWREGTLIHQPIFKNPQVADAIGAGDSFDAGFIAKFIRKKPLTECLEFGALAGAINTTRPGGTTAFTDYNTVKNIARKVFNKEL